MDKYEIFRRHINKEGECWVWTGLRQGSNRPIMHIGNEYYNPAVIAREIAGLSIPSRGQKRTNTCGNPLCVNPEHNLYPDVNDRFWSKVQKLKADECWLWMGAKYGNNGYGNFYITSTHRMMAHRYAYELVYCQIPEGMEVMHVCDNPLCVNPGHLKLGLHRDNMADMAAKNRSASGEAHPFRKLTWSDIEEIRNAFPDLNKKQLGRKYGVSATTIRRIINRKIWAK